MATGDSGEETEEDVPALHAAAEDNDIDAARKLLERQDVTVGVNEFWESETPLHICCRLGHSRLAAILLDHGANPDYLTDNRQETPLFLASREGHLEVVKLLVEKGGCLHGNVDVGLDALYVASVCGSAAVLRYLIQEGVVFEEHHPPHGHTPLTCACRHGRKEIVQELISAGCDVNKPMDNGHSGVFLAAMFQFADIVRLLVQAQAEVNDYSVQFQGCPLHMACRNKDIGTVQALLGAADCDVDVIQDEGQTPLYIAAGLGELDIVETLIAEGADPDIETLDTGNTPLFACLERPLHAAAGAADALKPPAPLPLVRSLISAGCDVDHENRGGVTPLQAALDRENCDAALLLLSADCSVSSGCWFTSEMDVYIISLENSCEQLYSSFVQARKHPRTLMCLARIAIKWVVKSSADGVSRETGRALPYSTRVKKLPLPTALKQFVAYENL